MSESPKVIALHLPQFHPIPENDEWWGKGFTEWNNVVKGKPRFAGHHQPHLPGDLGFYDLRLAEARAAQANLAKEYEIHGFCYYHYWFNGRRILEGPVDAILASGKPNFPFMLCWANENWSRNWDGGFNKILLEQKYSKEDFVNHARHLVKYFQDPRYIKIDGRPVFAIYKDGIGEDLEEFIVAFRAELQKHSLDVFLCRFERRIGTSENFAKAFKIFDAGIEFQPLTRQFKQVPQQKDLLHKIKDMGLPVVSSLLSGLQPADSIFRYRDVVENDLAYDFQRGQPIFPGVCPGWDNSARRPKGSALILDGSSPELFGKWVQGKIAATDWSLLQAPFLFVNAWNEWAEGNHLEPCARWGTRYLAALRDAVGAAGSLPEVRPIGRPAQVK